ncbi:MAG: hypothetical protein MUO50_13020 [Longimicrobiales bacterium]|nr:hypothetical protein [Longimicrobiales bacterium]
MKPKSRTDINTIDLTRPLEVVALGVKSRATRCRFLEGKGEFILRATGSWSVIPGEILTVMPHREWRFGGFPYLAGAVRSTRLDIGLLGLKPLGLRDRGMWDPQSHYWGEEGEAPDEWQKALIAEGPRPLFEMEQVIPGEDPDDIDSDPILESVNRREVGDIRGAARLLMDTLEADLRCLDAHAHLGNLWFDWVPERAIRHYEVGIRIGELSLEEGFDGVLSWGLIDNRPFLRCLQSYGLCLWRLGRFDAATATFQRMLRLNPSDNQGVRFLIDSIREKRPWKREGEMDVYTLFETAPWDWPPEANGEILRVLRDRKVPEAERLLAAELAGELLILDDVLGEELLRILEGEDEAEPLRAKAAISLGPVLEEADMARLDDPNGLALTVGMLRRVKTSLLGIHHDAEVPKGVRRSALEASVRAPEPWHSAAVRAAYYDGDPEWKLTAVFCMRYVPGFDDEIVEALETNDTEVLQKAVYAARDKGLAGAWPHLRKMILLAASGTSILPHDPKAEKSLLLAAMNAVATIRPLDAHETLSRLVDSDDADISETAIEILEDVETLWMLDDEEADEEPTWH